MASALHATRPGLATAQVGLAFDSFSFSNHILSVTSAWRSGMAPGSFAHPSSPARPGGGLRNCQLVDG